MADIMIQRGFEDALRHPTAEIFWEAFGSKLGFTLGDAARGVPLLAESFVPQHVFIALDGEQVLGVLALRDNKGMDGIDISLELMMRHYGLSGLLRLIVMGLVFNTHANDGELWVDSIAVAAAARGRGVGTKLLEAAFQVAADGGYKTIGLEVVDQNPRAQALYERLGFVVTAEKSVKVFTRRLGFNKFIRMSRRIA